MKNFSVMLLIFLFASVCCAQNNSSDCQSRMDFLNDNVDMFAFSFTGRVKEIKILEKNLEADTPRETTTTIKFDDKGKITETFLTNARIKMFGRTVYDYDGNNRIIKKTSYNPDGSAVFEYIYGYNSNGNLESKTTQNAIKKNVISKTEYKYESPISYLEYDAGKFVRRVKLSKDEKCRIIESNLYKETDKFENRLTTKYDEKDTATELIVYSPSGKPIEKIKYEYEYDGNGNWIKQNVYEWRFEDGDLPYKLTKIKQRNITYQTSK